MRRIKKATVKFLSLVKRGANQLPVLYKADDGTPGTGTVEVQMLVKALPEWEEKGELLAIGYVPEHRDSQGDIADAEVCKEMGHSFMREGANLDIKHDGKVISRDRAYVAESFTIQKGDERFANTKDYSGKTVDATGGWATLIKIEDKELRRLFKEEGWNGVSLAGPAEMEPDDSVRKALENFRQNQGDYEMKPEELEAVLTKSNTAMLAAVKEALTPKAPEQKPADAPAIDPAAPKFTGNPLVKAEVEAHATKLKAYKLQKSVDWNDPAAVDAYLATLEKDGPGDDDDDTADDDADADGDEEVVVQKVEKSKRRTSQPPEVLRKQSKLPTGLRSLNLSKQEIEGYDIGAQMAEFVNPKQKAV